MKKLVVTIHTFESWKVNTVAARTLRQFAYNRGSYADYVTGAV